MQRTNSSKHEEIYNHNDDKEKDHSESEHRPIDIIPDSNPSSPQEPPTVNQEQNSVNVESEAKNHSSEEYIISDLSQQGHISDQASHIDNFEKLPEEPVTPQSQSPTKKNDTVKSGKSSKGTYFTIANLYLNLLNHCCHVQYWNLCSLS